MNLLKTIKKGTKYFASALLAAVIFSQFIGVASVNAASPRFNFRQNDWEVLRGLNKTLGQTDWVDPTTGKAGDTFAGIVFYHNGELDTVAKNTRVKVSIPAQTTNKTAKLAATISADNAPAVTNTIVDGKVIGNSGLTVNLDQDATLSLVPGSIKWFPDFTSIDVTNKQIPFGQSGDEIVSAAGLNIGDIQGCWEHIGYVTFRFQTTAIAQASMTISKTVRNVTLGETNYVEQNQAKPGDTLEYKVTIKNSGAGKAENLFLTDTLPANTSYVVGSTNIVRNGGSVSALSDGVAGDGVTIGTMNANDTTEIRFKAVVSSGVANGETLINTAFLHFNKDVLTDTATTIVKVTSGAVSQTPAGPGLPKTGPDGIVITFLVVMFSGLAYTFVRYKKALKQLLARS